METDKKTFQTSHGRRTQVLWVGAVLLVAVVIGVAWMRPPLKTKQGGLPNALPAAQTALDSLDGRMNSAEEKLSAWVRERAGLTDRMTQIDKSATSNIRRARTEALALVEGVKRDLGRGLGAIESRLSGIESTQRETHDEVARLQADLAAVRHDLDGIREANAQQANHLGRIDQAQQSTQHEVSGLETRMLSSQDRVDALSYQVERKRIDFEVSKDRTDEVVAGIYLTIKHTDVARQRIDGWLQIASDGRFVWLHDSGAQQPIAFSSMDDQRTYELVFTRIADDAAAGYLLVPVTAANTETAAQ